MGADNGSYVGPCSVAWDRYSAQLCHFSLVTTTAEIHSVGVSTSLITPIFDHLSNSCSRGSLRALDTHRVGSGTG